MTAARRPVLWYVHHHGTGHWRQALATCRHLDRPVVFASSSPPPAPPAPYARWFELADDRDRSPRSPTAGHRLHWAPLGHRGLLQRHRQLLQLAEEIRPAVAVVDVSVEIVVLLRMSGIPVVSVRLPGGRDDEAHQLGFDLSDVVVAPVPAGLGVVPPGPTTHHVGFVSAIELGERPWRAGGPIVVVAGTGGTRIGDDVAAQLAFRYPDRTIELIGGSRAHGGTWLDDPEPMLARASVVVGNAGLGTVADSLACGRPLVVVPESRPFGEQSATAAALADHQLAVVVEDPQDADELAAAISTAERRGPTDPALARGAVAFAAVIDDVAQERLENAS